jgi:rhodanese-related sulfurtransferase
MALMMLIVSALFAVSCARQTTADWPGLKRTIRERFPGVHQISIEELDQWLSKPQPQRPLLLDARNSEEYAVSHLLGARLAASEEQALADLNDVAKDRLIVIYCSVGYRSSALAQKLMARGFTNVHNLEGSIFEWANEGRPVYRGEQPVRLVHPYDQQWGVYLKRELWSALVSDKSVNE